MSDTADTRTGATRETPDLSARLARFIHELSYDRIPPIVVARAKIATLDTIGVALAAVSGEIGMRIVDYARAQGGAPRARIWGAGFRCPAPWAALANGTLAHALDYDDTNYGMNGHMSSILVPAAFAVAERDGASGRAVIEGYVAGFEIGSRLGRDMNPDHYESGWHSTATIGHIAAVAAAAKVMRLDRPAIERALGIAATEAGGLRANIGSMTKPLHSGLAAKNGVIAADLAKLGWTSSDNAMGARYGFTDMFAPGRPIGAGLVGLGETYDVETIWVAQKPYPSCAASHRAIDGVIALRAEHRFTPDEIERVDCGVDYMVPTYMTYPDPTTPEQARFSMEYTLAVAAADGAVGLEHYEPARLADPAVRALAKRVRMYIHPELAGRDSWKARFVELTIHLRNGRVHHLRVHDQRGHPKNPMSEDEQIAKFRDAAGRALPLAHVEALLSRLRALEDESILSDLASIMT